MSDIVVLLRNYILERYHNKHCSSLTDRICIELLNYRILSSDEEHILKIDCFLCVQNEKSLREQGFLNGASSPGLARLRAYFLGVCKVFLRASWRAKKPYTLPT